MMGGQMAGMDPKRRQEMMEKRMDVMQMMQHDQAMGAMTAK